MKLLFATNNAHKLQEIRTALPPFFEVAGLEEIGISEEIPETAPTLEGNAIQKAEFIYNKLAISCFADDTGLEVDALDNRPGVYSARYAGNECNSENNIKKILKELEGVRNRKAMFRTVIAFIHEDQIYCFEGQVQGEITTEKKGEGGFGYDPIFIPEGHTKTFAQMLLIEKNKISHRSKALEKFVSFINSEIKNK
jgi:XTP/dITP diphosphohydrolase